MLEKRPMVGKGKRTQKSQTTIRLADGRTVEFPVDNPNPIELAKAIKRHAHKRRSAVRRGLDARRLRLEAAEAELKRK